MARRKSELIGPMSLQPVAHHSTQAVQSPAAAPKRSTQGQHVGRSATQDAVQAAKAKISRRNSLKKQRQLLKGKGGVSAFDTHQKRGLKKRPR